MKRFVAAALLLGLSALAAAQDWSERNDEFSQGYAESKALCRRLKDREPPASDSPDAAAARALEGCDSEALYYGIGMKADPVKARQCAFLEARKPGGEEGTFEGRTMLMTIYANGIGARRDLDVAIHLACGLDGAPAEMHGRVMHLAEMKAARSPGSDFDFCNDITSGLAMGYCADHDARVAGAVRDSKLARLAAGWSPAEAQALASLRKAHEAFADAHSSGEIDLSGTARAAIAIGEDEKLRDELLDLLQRLAAGRAPSFSHAQFLAADAKLNSAYRRRLAAIQAVDSPGAVTKEGVREAQRAWLRYRDAFLAFAALKFPSVSRDGLAAWVTERRAAMLSDAEA